MLARSRRVYGCAYSTLSCIPWIGAPLDKSTCVRRFEHKTRLPRVRVCVCWNVSCILMQCAIHLKLITIPALGSSRENVMENFDLHRLRDWNLNCQWDADQCFSATIQSLLFEVPQAHGQYDCHMLPSFFALLLSTDPHRCWSDVQFQKYTNNDCRFGECAGIT